jgi:mannosyltransferase
MSRLDETTQIPRLRDVPTPRHDPWGEDAGPMVAPTPSRFRTALSHLDAMIVWFVPMLVMTALAVTGAARPALWSDELMTWGMATAPWAQMFGVLKWVDITIAPYYVLIHLWVGVAGTSDLALRLPSILAMAGAAGLVGALGARLSTRRVGLYAGLLFAVLPNVTRYAQEARAYALTTFVAVLATWLFVLTMAKPAWWRYVLYVLSVALLGALHPVAVLLILAHAWITFAYHRRQIIAFTVSVAVGVAPAAYLLYRGNTQKAQVAWIPPPTPAAMLHFPADLVGLGTIGVALGALALFSLPIRRTAALCTAWAVLPLLGLLAAAQVTPIFLPRYLLFTMPAWALLAAMALARVPRVVGILALVGVAALSLPAQLAVRAPDGHGEATTQLVQTLIANERAGDAVIYGMADSGGDWTGRDALAHYLPAGLQPTDVLMVKPQRTNGSLAAVECTDVAYCLRDTKRLWIVRVGDLTDPIIGLDGQKEEIVGQRYVVNQVWHLTGLTLALAVPAPPQAVGAREKSLTVGQRTP